MRYLESYRTHGSRAKSIVVRVHKNHAAENLDDWIDVSKNRLHEPRDIIIGTDVSRAVF